MQNLRPLKPAPQRPESGAQDSVSKQPSKAPAGSGEKKQSRHRHTDEEWEGQKELLAQLLYIHTLEDAAKIIKDTNGFEAEYLCSNSVMLPQEC